ncbi:Hypothetical protein NTJ_14704 [Nesidiocoris tenuis]|uniref:Peptidase S1 domain-containing protein n=1 Tax=Nesidiocoris tenuis TaxID=355587 RepID=A0ABN7BBY7_9HEMI|nr:Hypothetical protein NTJ_14704 [Nesidiocoris tenuis]
MSKISLQTMMCLAFRWEGHFFVCAGGRNNPGGICQRDSGGLLVCNDLLAAVHYSYQDETCEGRPKCDDRYTFSVYSYVCPVLGFIRQYIRSAPRMPRHCRMRYSHRLPWVTTIRPPWVTTVPPPWVTTVPPPPKPGQPGYPQPGQPGCPQPAPPGNPQPAPPGNPQPVPPANPKPGQPDPRPDDEEYEDDYDDRAVRSLNITTWLVVIIATITIFNVFPWQN